MKRPEFIARQGGKPSGFLGRCIATVMQRETKDVNQRAIALLNIKRGDRVLDIGAGSGLSLRQLAALSGDGLAVGVDHSPVMCRRAISNNQALIADRRVSVECARGDRLPFETRTFDAAMSVHTLYFWDPAEPQLGEIARVLRPGGRLVLGFRPDDDPETADFPNSVYTFRSTELVKQLLLNCGFKDVSLEDGPDAIALLCATRH